MISAAALSATAPAVASAQAAKLTLTQVVLDGSPSVKVIVLLLVVAGVAAVVVGLRKLVGGKRLAGGSSFLAGTRWAAPLLGAFGASLAGLGMALGTANAATPPSVMMLAPGFAEIATLLGLGFLVGAVAAIFNWAVESRLDREVLS